MIVYAVAYIRATQGTISTKANIDLFTIIHQLALHTLTHHTTDELDTNVSNYQNK